MGRSKRRAAENSPGPSAGQGHRDNSPLLSGGDRQGSRGFEALARPWLLAVTTALWVARPLFPSESAATEGDGLPAVMLWIALAVLWLLGAIGQARFRLRFGWVDLAVLLLAAWHSIAAFWAASHLSPRPAVNMLWEWVGFAVSFFLARQLVVGRSEVRAVAAVMCSLAVALAAFGIYQYAYEMPVTRAEYLANPDAALAEAELWYAPGSPEREMYEKRLASVEPTATFALTNSLAGYLAPWLIVLAGMATIGRPDRRTWLSLLGPTICALMVATCLFLTKSRSAALAVLFGLVLIGIAWRQKSARIPWKFAGATALALVVLAAGAVAVGGLDVQVFSEATKSLGYRGQYWRSTLAMIGHEPVLGCGPGNFQEAYLAYKLPEASEEIADPHNFLFEVWATAGTPAMLALAAALAGFFIAVLRPRREKGFVGPPSGGAPPEGGTTNAVPDGPRKEYPGFVCAGALLGFATVNVIAAVSVAPPDLWLFVVAIPSACAAMALLWPWVRGGDLPAGLAAIGAAVLLVNLSAAGGIGFAGVSGGLWLLMAIGLNAAEPHNARSLPGWSAWGLLAAAAALAYACYATAYGPVLQSQAAMRLAKRQPLQAEQYLRQAAVADPLAVEPLNNLAALAFAGWKANPNDETLRRVEQYTDLAITRAPKSASAYRAAGDRYQEMYRRTKQRRWLEKAVADYRRAVELYPNSAVRHAQLATALRDAGDTAGFETERDKALWLDEVTPHSDKKLPAELRNSLQRRNSRHN